MWFSVLIHCTDCCFLPLSNIGIHHECASGKEKSVPRITDWQASRGLPSVSEQKTCVCEQ